MTTLPLAHSFQQGVLDHRRDECFEVASERRHLPPQRPAEVRLPLLSHQEHRLDFRFQVPVGQ
jgi:hypothetical protein